MLLGSSSGSATTCYRYSDCCSQAQDLLARVLQDNKTFASIKALHDIHYYILILMLCHIFMTVFVMWGSSKRVQIWEKENTKIMLQWESNLLQESTAVFVKLFVHAKQFHESVDHFTYVAIKNYFIARNKICEGAS